MQMIQCPNCGRLTGFKRALGFGTFFMVLLTCGLWLLVIPFYPARCITCGLTRHTAVFHNFGVWYRGLSPAARGFVIIAPLALLFGLGILNALKNGSQPKTPTTLTGNNALDSNAGSEVPAAAPVIYSVAQINVNRNDIPTGTELIVQGTYSWQRWGPTDACTRLLTNGVARVEHGEADPRAYCWFFFVLQDEDTRQVQWLECAMSPERLHAALRQYVYGDKVQARGTYASSLDFQAGGPGGVPVLEDCTLTPLSPLHAPGPTWQELAGATPSTPAPAPTIPAPAPLAEQPAPTGTAAQPGEESYPGAAQAAPPIRQATAVEARTDGQIEMDVLHALGASSALKDSLIAAATAQGEVTLSGTVSSEALKEVAGSIAARVAGVTKLHNNLTLAQTGSQPANVAEGQTPDQVIAILGPPVSVTLGAKHVYSYSHLKVVFVDGKVSEIHPF